MFGIKASNGASKPEGEKWKAKVVRKNGGRLYKALTRLAMGYTLQDDQKVRIYALVLKVFKLGRRTWPEEVTQRLSLPQRR